MGNSIILEETFDATSRFVKLFKLFCIHKLKYGNVCKEYILR